MKGVDMELNPEERRLIFEEEKARAERLERAREIDRERLRAQAQIRMEKFIQQNPSIGLIFFVIASFFILVVFLLSSSSNPKSTSSNTYSSETVLQHDGKSQTQADIEQQNIRNLNEVEKKLATDPEFRRKAEEGANRMLEEGRRWEAEREKLDRKLNGE